MTSTTFDFGMPSGAPGRARRKSNTSITKSIIAWFSGLFPSQTAQVESEVATFIEHHGGVLTDDVEREISRRFGSIAGR